jgi:hypothetical protein
MEPGKTSFFQALGVPTKIARGTIEITTDLKLVEAGSKVGASEATLLNLLNISPFTYGLGIAQVYDEGQSFPPHVLDIGEEQLLATLTQAITTIAVISLAANFPTLPSVIHSVVNSYKKVLAVAVETEFSWPENEELKDRIANPDAYAAAAPAAGSAPAAAAEAAAPAAEEEKEESEDEDMGFGLLYVLQLCSLITVNVADLLLATKYSNENKTPSRHTSVVETDFSRTGYDSHEVHRKGTYGLTVAPWEYDSRFSQNHDGWTNQQQRDTTNLTTTGYRMPRYPTNCKLFSFARFPPPHSG